MHEVGVTCFGSYVPRLRVSRADIAAAHSWLNPSLSEGASGSRSSCGWDEDVITMAVEAARACMDGLDRTSVGVVQLASTTAPFADRLNAGVVAGALALAEDVRALDIAGSHRAGTSALIAAADTARAGNHGVLCVASERRAASGATSLELSTGHAAASVVMARNGVAARLVAAESLTADLVDHHRLAGHHYEYGWEERWIRDEGWLKVVPRLVSRLLREASLTPNHVSRFCVSAPTRRIATVLASRCGLPASTVPDLLHDELGHSGAAHPLLLLVDALEQAHAGDRILVVGFGQGGDALLFEVTEQIAAARRDGHRDLRWQLRCQRPCSYTRFATLNGLLTVDRGKRAEADKGTAHSAAWRHRDLLLALSGGRCTVCGTHQIPRSAVCVSPACKAVDSQVAHSFAESLATVATWSADSLIDTPDPPAHYGMLDFDEGGRLTMDFADIDPGTIDVGTRMRMVFRVKDHDAARGFTRYFWKGSPLPTPPSSADPR